MGDRFKGYYFKHQKGDQVVIFIVGRAENEAFVQVVTNTASYQFSYDPAGYADGDTIELGGCTFSKEGVIVALENEQVRIRGQISYQNLTPLQYDVMGIFRYLPMQCRHGIISMRHDLSGGLTIGGDTIDFTGGIGYIEQDSGSSFPRQYFWVQCNDFGLDCAVFASAADVRAAGIHFKGCIAAVLHEGRAYRFATYLGAKILLCCGRRLILKQGRYVLDIIILSSKGQALRAPVKGHMTRTISESVACKARFRLSKGRACIFDLVSDHASFEFVPCNDLVLHSEKQGKVKNTEKRHRQTA